MKRAEYREAPEAQENFERGMKALFKVPKADIVQQRPQNKTLRPWLKLHSVEIRCGRMKRVPTFAVLVTLAMIFGCDDTKQAPKGIDADGRVYVACKGFVRISGNLQEGYQVHFTDASGSDHDVRGIHKLEVEDLPDKTVCAVAESKADAEKGNVPEAKDN